MAKILVAEDETHIADMITFKLSNAGHRVVRAHDGEEAMTLAGIRPTRCCGPCQ
jgi:DNA-binding response OmpR family regulator